MKAFLFSILLFTTFSLNAANCNNSFHTVDSQVDEAFLIFYTCVRQEKDCGKVRKWLKEFDEFAKMKTLSERCLKTWTPQESELMSLKMQALLILAKEYVDGY
jgi:hypothetical protein